MLTRNEAINLLKQNIKRQNVFYHMLAVEAIMRNLANYFGENEEIWGLTGLLHDIDFELTKEDFSRHGLLAESIIGDKVPPEVIKAIKSHNKLTGVEPTSKLDKALIAADAISGLLIACALVMPSKKLSEVKVKTVKKKFKAKDFARGADRNRILYCEQIGIEKERFFEIALNSLKKVAKILEL